MNLFFELIQLSLGKRDSFSFCPSEQDWKDLFEQAKKQALIGVLFSGVERLSEGLRPPKNILLQWYALIQQIEEKNKFLNKQVVTVSNKFQKDGFKTCILKGQGNALLYPNPLRRQSGDIDIWLCPDDCIEKNAGLESCRKKILSYVNRITKPDEIVYHHVDFNVLKDTDIEIHFTPSWMFNPFNNKRLQRYFIDNRLEQFNNKVFIDDEDKHGFYIPTPHFNLIYQHTHIYRHLFQEGIGLRQLMDYYFLLRSWRVRSKENDTLNYEVGIINYDEYGQSTTLNDEIIELLKSLKLEKFAGAMMWVLGEVFGLERELMLVAPNEKEGRFLLDEIMMAGNFGKYDTRINLSNNSFFNRLTRRHKQTLKFWSAYPQEAVWEIPFRTWHYCWRKLKGYM